MKQEIYFGKTYKVTHIEKGTFSLMVVDIDNKWIRGKITQGQARVKGSYFDIKSEGDMISVRRNDLRTVQEVKRVK